MDQSTLTRTPQTCKLAWLSSGCSQGGGGSSGKKNGTCIQRYGFSEGCRRDWFLSCLIWGTDREPKYSGCHWAQHTFGCGWVGWLGAGCSTRKSVVPQTDTGGSKRQEKIWKKAATLATSLIGKLASQAQRSHIHQKSFLRSPESLARLIIKGLPLPETSLLKNKNQKNRKMMHEQNEDINKKKLKKNQTNPRAEEHNNWIVKFIRRVQQHTWSNRRKN